MTIRGEDGFIRVRQVQAGRWFVECVARAGFLTVHHQYLHQRHLLGAHEMMRDETPMACAEDPHEDTHTAGHGTLPETPNEAAGRWIEERAETVCKQEGVVSIALLSAGITLGPANVTQQAGPWLLCSSSCFQSRPLGTCLSSPPQPQPNAPQAPLRIRSRHVQLIG